MTMTVTVTVTVALALALALACLGRPALAADPSCNWLGDDLPMPLPLTVETPRDIAFKGAAERQYLILNLLAGGKLAWQRGDYAAAVQKWEALLRTSGLDPHVEKAVTPFLADARERLGQPPHENAAPPPASMSVPAPAATDAEKIFSPDGSKPAIVAGGQSPETVNGTVFGGGQIGPGGAVVWLRRTDGPMPPVVPLKNSITQRNKTFIPHVLAVPTGSTVEFRNDDRIYHNVFSLAKPNDFDAGVRATGATYTRKFDRPGAVDILCNIHATMSAFIYVVDSPFFAKARPNGTFSIPAVPPGRYEIFAWHEASSSIAHKTLTVGPGQTSKVTLTVGGDKRPSLFAPDKYGQKRQTHLGY
jgi:plastocyanin